MARFLVRIGLLLPMLVLVAGCAEDVKHQIEFRGKWVLESRKLPDGQALQPPGISGFLEWFPITEKTSHVTVAFSAGEDHIQLADFMISLEGHTITREGYMEIGGGYAPAARPGTRTSRTTTRGQVRVEGEQIGIAYDDGTASIYKGTTLAWTHRDGTTDTWTRTDDQKGLLNK